MGLALESLTVSLAALNPLGPSLPAWGIINLYAKEEKLAHPTAIGIFLYQ